jgi:hypothetical protein
VNMNCVCDVMQLTYVCNEAMMLSGFLVDLFHVLHQRAVTDSVAVCITLHMSSPVS